MRQAKVVEPGRPFRLLEHRDGGRSTGNQALRRQHTDGGQHTHRPAGFRIQHVPIALAIDHHAALVIAASIAYEVPVARMLAELRRGFRVAIAPATANKDTQQLVWQAPRALFLVAGALFIGWLGFYLHRGRTATLGFSQVSLIGSRGIGALLSPLPTVLRMLTVCALAIALARPETYRIVKRQVDSIDIVIVKCWGFNRSKRWA